MTKKVESRELEKLVLENNNLKGFSEQLVEPTNIDHLTRARVARKFVDYYFGVFILLVVGVLLYNYIVVRADHDNLVVSLKDTILTYSAIVGPTFGLVVAYYFKSSKD